MSLLTGILALKSGRRKYQENIMIVLMAICAVGVYEQLQGKVR